MSVGEKYQLNWHCGQFIVCKPPEKCVNLKCIEGLLYCNIFVIYFLFCWKRVEMTIFCGWEYFPFFIIYWCSGDKIHHLVVVPNCQWSEWKRWNSCSATCGPGLQEWRRRCDCIPPVPGGGHCPGFPTKKEDCNNPCPPPPMPGLSYILQSRLKGPFSLVGYASYSSTNI